jgi:hypothetical protein
MLDESATLAALTSTLRPFRDAGAVYSPVDVIVPRVELPPTTPFTFHVTLLSGVCRTVAVNWIVCEGIKDAVFGVIVIVTGAAGG